MPWPKRLTLNVQRADKCTPWRICQTAGEGRFFRIFAVYGSHTVDRDSKTLSIPGVPLLADPALAKIFNEIRGFATVSDCPGTALRSVANQLLIELGE